MRVTAVDPVTDCATFLLWRVAQTGSVAFTDATFATLAAYGWTAADVLAAVRDLNSTGHVTLHRVNGWLVAQGM